MFSGPVHWGETFKQCIGKFQSPINIIEHNVIPVDLPTIKFVDFDKKAESAEIVNNGHTGEYTYKILQLFHNVNVVPLYLRF